MNTIEDTKENILEPDSSNDAKEKKEGDKNLFPPGTLLGTRYEIIEVIGTGGFGAVYKAKDLVLDEVVALKVLDERFSKDKNTLERFKREIKLARKITDKNVVRIFDIDEVDNYSIISMEYFHGKSLKEILKKEGKLSKDRAIDIGIQICSALHNAHKNGVIHRDIKPQNILINNDDFVKIVDFGIARSSIDFSPSGSSKEITKTGVIVGTPEYLSPEQVDGKMTVDHRSDIYSVGVVLYEMFTGDVPFKGNTPIATILKRVNEPPPPITSIDPKLPKELDRIIVKTAMAINPEDRYSNILELSEDLSYLKDIPSVSRDDTLSAITKTTRLPARLQKQIEELEREGTRLYLAKNYVESAKIWEKILEIDPRDEKAAHFYKKASLKREDVKNKFREAQHHYKKGGYRASIKLLEEVISLYKDHNEALNLLEKARKQLNRKGDKVAGIYIKKGDTKTPGLGFKVAFIVLFILTVAFLYLQYVSTELPLEDSPATQTENIEAANQEVVKPPAGKTNKISAKPRKRVKKQQPVISTSENSFGYLTITVPILNGKRTWAKIYIDGKFYNYTPQAKIKLKPGKHKVSLKFEDNNLLKKEEIITIKPGGKRVIHPSLNSPSNKSE